MPKKQMKHYEDLPLKFQTIPRSRDHDKGAVHGHFVFGPIAPGHVASVDHGTFTPCSRE
jgi:hypothetical protein